MWHLAGMPVVERNYALVVNSFGWTSLALVVICLRLFTRAIIVRGLGWDDWFMAGAFINSVGFLVAEMFQIKYGLGQPVNLVTLNPFLAALLATVTLYNIAQALYKLSITTQAYRLFTIYLDKRIMQILISWIITCGIMSVCGSIFYCFPVSKVWNIEADGHCVNRTVLYYCISAFNILSDLMLVMIPLRFLLKLRVAQKQRIVLVCVFGCGALVTIISTIRLKALYINLSGPYEMQPITGVDIALWSHLEINIAIICGSVPALKAFFCRIVLRQASEGSGYNGNSHRFSSRTRRHQSHVLHRSIDDTCKDKQKITIQQPIEMNSHFADDTSSERELISSKAFSPAIGNHGRVTGVSSTEAMPSSVCQD